MVLPFKIYYNETSLALLQNICILNYNVLFPRIKQKDIY